METICITPLDVQIFRINHIFKMIEKINKFSESHLNQSIVYWTSRGCKSKNDSFRTNKITVKFMEMGLS